MPEKVQIQYDALVLGGGIAGMQAALDLAEQGYTVALVERTETIGGNMIKLSKVFPTLDCASCITTPKMAAVAHHRNITLMTLCELRGVGGAAGDFEVKVRQQPRYVDTDRCIGCMKCEMGCPILAPSREQHGFAGRKAIYVPFASAIPQVPRLDAESCTLCGKCAGLCPTGAIDYFQKPRDLKIRTKALVLATGYKLLRDYPARAWGEAADQPNLVDALQMECLLAPAGPYKRLLRPSDGKEPESVAFIQCAGSRDTQLGVRHCSRVCCMYNIKQATLLKREHPGMRLAIYCMDVRCFGKGYEQFYRNALEMGVEFVRSKGVVTGRSDDDGVIVRHDDMEGSGGPRLDTFDMGVLSLAIVPAWTPDGLAPVRVAEDGFLASRQPKLSSTLTSSEGVFMAGVAAGPKDIVDTVVEAGAAASEAGIFLKGLQAGRQRAA
ncbi:MAG: FAD-dependent oxidoreductase [Deltaproteobacteria bacterium]|nr:FAD-dependent oxidoreductase [Deltaproteobacteria bacterium]